MDTASWAVGMGIYILKTPNWDIQPLSYGGVVSLLPPKLSSKGLSRKILMKRKETKMNKEEILEKIDNEFIKKLMKKYGSDCYLDNGV